MGLLITREPAGIHGKPPRRSRCEYYAVNEHQAVVYTDTEEMEQPILICLVNGVYYCSKKL